jgi:hypothetical protein
MTMDADTLAAVDAALERYDRAYRCVHETQNTTQEAWNTLKEIEVEIDPLVLPWLRSLRDEVRRLQSSITAEKSMRKDAGDRTETLTEENAKLRDVLRELEWCDHGNYCPVCNADSEAGHEPDCKLAALLVGESEPQGEDPRAVLRSLLAELDDFNGYRPTALSPGGVLYERAKRVAGKE